MTPQNYLMINDKEEALKMLREVKSWEDLSKFRFEVARSVQNEKEVDQQIGKVYQRLKREEKASTGF